MGGGDLFLVMSWSDFYFDRQVQLANRPEIYLFIMYISAGNRGNTRPYRRGVTIIFETESYLKGRE